jgi:aspartyl-tRNA synthetase
MATPAFFAAGNPDKFYKFAGERPQQGRQELGLIDENAFAFAWIVDFPMYEYNEDEKRVDFSHNPFSMPQGGLESLENDDPLAIKAFQYDIACNGFELASGGIRNQSPEAMVKAFEMVGLWRGDGDRALRRHVSRLPVRRAAPWRHGFRHRPHHHAPGRRQEPARGCAVPDEPAGVDLLMGAPSEASPKQLRELIHATTINRWPKP